MSSLDSSSTLTLANYLRPPTLKELEALILISHGAGEKEVAAKLKISIRTVKSRLSTMRERYDFVTTTQAVAESLRHGWIA